MNKVTYKNQSKPAIYKARTGDLVEYSNGNEGIFMLYHSGVCSWDLLNLETGELLSIYNQLFYLLLQLLGISIFYVKLRPKSF